MSRGAIAGVAALLMGLGAALLANTASADSIQYQSYQRASQSEACTSQPGESVWQTSWGVDSSWKPTWEQWANGGKGGWTCTRSITWAKTAIAGGSASLAYSLGDIGPGGGLVFLIDNGVRYEMAPKTWNGVNDPTLTWCDSVPVDVAGAIGEGVGTGAANTAAMHALSACSSNAAAAVLAYAPAGSSAGEWFLPSNEELNAMCNYSRNPTSPIASNVNCYGTSGTVQDPTFASSVYGFVDSDVYWSSSQYNSLYVIGPRYWLDGSGGLDSKDTTTIRVRPIRAF
jgi:hypothetical protein